MATYYVGPGGNDANTGLSWAQRFLTLNGAEDEPVAAGDLVYVGPGVYRETLTVDVNGGAGTEITYVADVTGEHTDGVGGVVRITGSDNDTTMVRANCVVIVAHTHRIFRGFRIDMASGYGFSIGGASTDITIEDCVFTDNDVGFLLSGVAHQDVTFRRCLSVGNYRFGYFWNGAAVDIDVATVFENCFIVGARDRALVTDTVGGITLRNCTVIGCWAGVRVNVALHVNQSITVENCIFTGCIEALFAQAVGEIVEDYNTFFLNTTDRNNVNVGGNSETYPALVALPLLHSGVAQISGFEMPWWFGELSEWSLVRAITGSNEPTEDLRGIVRPTTAAKNSWGPVQFADAERETGTVHTGLVGIVLHDAASHQIFVPITATSTTISVYVYREANYAGTNPQLVVKQPGQADDVTTDTAASAQWNLLSTTFTPAANPPYVVVELQSLNTAAAGNFNCYFDTLAVT